MKLYTAVGKYIIRNMGTHKEPIIILKRKEHAVDVNEMLIWSSLMWHIHTYDEIKLIFDGKLKDCKIITKPNFENYLNRLMQRGLIVCGNDMDGMNSIYSLISNLYIFPVKSTLITKVLGFLHLTINRKIPISVSKNVFKKDELSHDEDKVLSMAKKTNINVAELIMCLNKDFNDGGNSKKLLDTLYSDDTTTCDNIYVPSSILPEKDGVIQAVTNLYLKKIIIFETL